MAHQSRHSEPDCRRNEKQKKTARKIWPAMRFPQGGNSKVTLKYDCIQSKFEFSDSLERSEESF